MKEKKIFYLCDGNVEDCKKTVCHKNIGETGCRHTTDICHAMNFKKHEHPNSTGYIEQQPKSEVDKDIMQIMNNNHKALLALDSVNEDIMKARKNSRQAKFFSLATIVLCLIKIIFGI